MTTPRRIVTTVVAGPVTSYGPEIPWGNDGSAVSISTSPEIRPRATITVTGISATLTTAGSSATVVELFKNGASVRTVTIPAGETYRFVEFAPLRFRARVDRYQMQVTTAGTGAVGIAGAIELAG